MCLVVFLIKKVLFYSFILKFGMFVNGLCFKRIIWYVYENSVFKCFMFVVFGCIVGRFERKMGFDMNIILFFYFFRFRKFCREGRFYF